MLVCSIYVRMYASMCVFTCILYVYVHVRMHVSMYVFTYILYVYVHVHMHACMYVCMYACIYLCVYVSVSRGKYKWANWLWLLAGTEIFSQSVQTVFWPTDLFLRPVRTQVISIRE